MEEEIDCHLAVIGTIAKESFLELYCIQAITSRSCNSRGWLAGVFIILKVLGFVQTGTQCERERERSCLATKMRMLFFCFVILGGGGGGKESFPISMVFFKKLLLLFFQF